MPRRWRRYPSSAPWPSSTCWSTRPICINAGELIVGEKGPAPKATPTYPELCCHSLQDLDILDAAPEDPLRRQRAGRAQAYASTVIPFWQGRSLRELLFAEMTPEWQAAYEAGIFTEFMEQRAPGHTVLDDKIYHKGMLDFTADIERTPGQLDYPATTRRPMPGRKS